VTDSLDGAGLRRDVATANHICHEAGLVNVYGHVSARIPGTDTFLIPTRSSPGLARPETLLLMDVEGTKIDGEGSPNFEFWIHARIYAARPEVGAVAHVHSPACVALTAVEPTVRALHNVGAMVSGCPLYREVGLIGDPGKADRAAVALGEHPALLLRGHGANVVGADVRIATMLACFLEESAERNLSALMAAGGDPSRVGWLTADEVASLQESMSEGRGYAQALAGFTERFWEYHQARLAGRLCGRDGLRVG
jgi:ribulose-5-phosphate 4-epimerase/fuculose-1-phosphate aldolase